LPDSNYWHYALQLNTYRGLIESKYGKKVKELFLVRLHPDAEDKTYDLIKLPILNDELTHLWESVKAKQDPKSIEDATESKFHNFVCS